MEDQFDIDEIGIAKHVRGKRSLTLIANFANGFAGGWYFAVNESFKDALDIKMTPRVEPILKDGERQYEYRLVNGKNKKCLITKKVLRWTQGTQYDFTDGSRLYNTPFGYLVWASALKHISLACEVIKATPNNLDKKGTHIHGRVYFILSKPDPGQTCLETIARYDCTQNEFVRFLKTGQLDDIHPAT